MPDAHDLSLEIPGFTIEKVLGKGGLGAVYLARQHTLDRHVAIKVLRPDRDQDPGVFRRFLREAKVMARMDHPNLVRLFEFIESAVGPAISMEYFPCGTLRSELERLQKEKSVLGEKRSLHLAVELVAALEALHEEGVVHRDVKPTNIFLRDSKEAVLGDLGASSRATDEETEITSAGMLVGTASYMAPELWKGLPATPMADIFALGVTLHECLTGVHPHPQRVTGPEFQFSWAPQHLKEISRPTRELVEKMLSRDPLKRAVDVAYLLKILPDTGVSINLEKLAQSIGKGKLPPPAKGRGSRRAPADAPPGGTAPSRLILVLSVLISSALSFVVGLKLRTGLDDAVPPQPVASETPAQVPSAAAPEPRLELRERLLSRFRNVLTNIAPEVRGRHLGHVDGRFSDRVWSGWERMDGGAPPGALTLLFVCYDPAGEELRMVFPDWTPASKCRALLNGQTIGMQVSRNLPTQIEIPQIALRHGINRLLLVPEEGGVLDESLRGVLNRRGPLPLPTTRPLDRESPVVLARLAAMYERLRKGVWMGMREEALAMSKGNPQSLRIATFIAHLDASYVVTCRDMDQMGLQGMGGPVNLLEASKVLPDMDTALKNLAGSFVTLHGNLARNPHRAVAWSTLAMALGTIGGEIELGWRTAMYGCLLEPDDVSPWMAFGEMYAVEYATRPEMESKLPDALDACRVALDLAKKQHLDSFAADIEKGLEKLGGGLLRGTGN